MPVIAVSAVELRLFSVRGLYLNTLTPTSFVGTSTTPGVVSPGLDLTGQVPVSSISNELEFSPAAGALRLFSVRGLQLRGLTPELITGGVYTPATANLAVTGKIPDVPFFIPGAGGLSVEGQTVKKNFGFSRSVEIPEGGVSFTGLQPARAVGLDLVGHAPNPEIAQGQNKFRFPAEDDLSLAGLAPELLNTGPSNIGIPVPRRPVFLQVDEPALELFDPSLPPSLTLNMMQPASVVSDPIFYPAAEQLTFSGQEPIVEPVIIVSNEILVAVGRSPQLQRSDNKTPAPAAGSLAISGDAPTVFPNPVKFPAAGNMSLSSDAPSISWRVKINATRKLRITGKQPSRTDFGANTPVFPIRRRIRIQSLNPININVGYTIIIAEGGISVAGQTPVIEVDSDSLRIPFRDVITLSGKPAALQVDQKRSPGKAQLAITERGVGTLEKRYRRYGARTKFVRITTRYKIEVLYR